MDGRIMQFCAGLCACVFAGAAWGYEPGDGTGLRAQVVGPVNKDAYAPPTMDQFKVCETQEFANISLDRTSSIFSDGVGRCPVINWRGKLIVPETASYTFSATMRAYSYDGFRLVIDGVVLFDKGKVPQVSGNVVATTSPTELTAGEHMIEVDYAAQHNTSLKCILSWLNNATIPDYEVIPSTQFKPAATDEFPSYRYGELNAAWSGRAIGGGFFAPRQVGEKSFVVNNWAPESTGNGGYTSSCIGRYMEDAFRAEITYDMTDTTKTKYDGAFLYMNSSTNSATYMTYRMTRMGAAQINAYFKASSTQGDDGGRSANFNTGSSGSAKMRMRLERDPLGRFGCYYRELPDGEWKLCYQYDRDGHWVAGRSNPGDIATYPDKVFVGFGVPNSRSGQIDDVEFSNPLFAPVSFGVVADKTTAGVTLTWSNAANQASFKVKYRSAESAGEWITAAEDLPPDAETYRLTDGLQTYVTYEVKIVAVGADGEEQDSEVKPFTCGETGLYGVVMGPVEINSYPHYVENQCVVRETRLFADPYVNASSLESLFETTNFINGIVCWRGSLYVPATGTYGFQLLCNEGNRAQGARLAIDGVNYVNKRIYDNGVSAMTASVELTAGTHDLEIDFGSFNKNATVKCFEIQWKKPGDEAYARIAPSYFRPTVAVADLPRFSMDGFEFRFPGTGGKAKWTLIRKTDDGAYELTGPNPSSSGFGGYPTAVFGRKVKGPFVATFSLNWTKAPTAATASSPAIGLSVLNPTADGDHHLHFGLVGAVLTLSGSKSESDIVNVANFEQKWPAKKDWIRFKVIRKADYTITCKYSTRNEGTDWSPWTTAFVYDGNNYNGTVHGDLTTDSLFVGVTSSMVEPQKVYDLTITNPMPGLVIIVR